jgi:hypothetical protein
MSLLGRLGMKEKEPLGRGSRLKAESARPVAARGIQILNILGCRRVSECRPRSGALKGCEALWEDWLSLGWAAAKGSWPVARLPRPQKSMKIERIFKVTECFIERLRGRES